MTKRDLQRLDDLDAVLKKLNFQERFIVTARFGLAGDAPMTKKRIGEYLALSGQSITNTEKLAMHKLRHAIKAQEEAREKQLPSRETIQQAIKNTNELLAAQKFATRFETKMALRQRHFPWIEQTIVALQAYMRGETLQMRSTYQDWHDFDLGEELDRGMISWRAKPKGQNKNGDTTC